MTARSVIAAPLLVATALAPFYGHAAEKTPVTVAKEKPATYFRYETGSGSSGDLEMRVRRFRNPKTGKEVTLAGMMHLADADFYRRINDLAAKQDVVLLEGVKGGPTLSAIPLLYQVSLASRLVGCTRLEHQTDHLIQTGPKYRNADVDFSDMDTGGSALGGFVALPFVIVFGETGYTLSGLGEQVAWLTGTSRGYARTARALLADTLASEDISADKEFERVVLNDRNAAVLKALDEELAGPGPRKTLIPWGAAHHPGLEAGLISRGFKPVDEHWEKAVAVRSLYTSPATDAGWRWQLPYLVNLHGTTTTFGFSGPLGLVSVHDAPRLQENSSLWGLLHLSRHTDEETFFEALAGLGRWESETNDGSARESFTLAGLWGSYHEPEGDGTRLGWWGFLGGTSTARDSEGEEQTSEWHLPLTFGRYPLFYGQSTDAKTGETEHRFLLFFSVGGKE